MTGPSETGRVVVVVPTYDEVRTLPGTLARLRAAVPSADVLVVDDASPDGTGALADRIAASDPQVHVLHRAGKEGLGPAYVAGFHWALDRGYDVVVEMDADGSHRPEELPRILAGLADHDLVLGSRWVPGGSVENWPRHREVLSRVGNLYARAALGIGLRDATGGFRAYRATLLRDLPLSAVASQGYCFQVDMAWRSLGAGARVTEVPIRFVERTEGHSKMSRRIVVEAFARITAWGARQHASRLRRAVDARRAATRR